MSQVEQALQRADQTCAVVVGSNVLPEVVELFRSQFPGSRAVVIADENTFDVAGREVDRLLRNAGVVADEPFIFPAEGLFAEFTYVQTLDTVLAKTDAIPVAVGSGTINDLTKLSSYRSGRRYMCVGTAASMDGYTAYGASITLNGSKQTITCPAPQAFLGDIDVISAAPPVMTASGYADLFAKVTAGADWILSEELDVESIEPFAWSVVQDGLKDALSDPEGARAGQPDAIEKLTDGLLLGGFAMQAYKSSRPASGSEHQFSHLWDMEHHRFNGASPSHGFKVSIGMTASIMMYEYILSQPLDQLDVELCCRNWPDLTLQQAEAIDMFKGSDIPDLGRTEITAKYISREGLRTQLTTLRDRWPVISDRLRSQLIPLAEVKHRLALVGAPTEPEQIGISRSRMAEAFIRAQKIRRRFTILDLAQRIGQLDKFVQQYRE